MTLSCPRGESQFSRPLKSSKKTPIGQKKPLDAPPLASEETINRSAMWKAMFNGTNVFLSRNLVPPEAHDAAHDAVKLNGAYDALKLNGAQVFLCCDPSRNSPDDYHIISSPDHEKFELLKSKGCNLLGPQCVLSCAKERRVLPKQGYTCCLAMDGVKVLAFGFEREKKAIIGKLVAGMGGILQTKASLDVNFVIVKDVLAAKYKYVLNVLKKPIVNLNWLFQCWSEHRVVPQESFRILPFTGLTVCVTRISPVGLAIGNGRGKGEEK